MPDTNHHTRFMHSTAPLGQSPCQAYLGVIVRGLASNGWPLLEPELGPQNPILQQSGPALLLYLDRRSPRPGVPKSRLSNNLAKSLLRQSRRLQEVTDHKDC